jgi:hypothetical protein
MRTTKLKTSRFNTETNWERIKEFMLRFTGDIVLDEDHQIVCHELCEKHGLVINLGQTSCNDEPNEQIIFAPDSINKGTIQANRLTLSDDSGEEHTLDFYQLIGAPIK